MEVQVPITPMLDMAFQLLTFFILTYRPAPTEGQFSMNLLPPQAATEINKEQPKDAAPSIDASLRTLTTVLRAGGDGTLGEITLADKPIQDMVELKKELEGFVNDPIVSFDQATHFGVDPQPQHAEPHPGDRRLLVAQAEALDQDQLLRAVPDRGRRAAVRRRPSSLFRGSELPRLLFLSAIAVPAGWPI